jgi:hypothetical protein
MWIFLIGCSQPSNNVDPIGAIIEGENSQSMYLKAGEPQTIGHLYLAIHDFAHEELVIPFHKTELKDSWDILSDANGQQSQSRNSVVRNIQRLSDSSGVSKAYIWPQKHANGDIVLLVPFKFGSYMVFLYELTDRKKLIFDANHLEIQRVWVEEGFFLGDESDGTMLYVSCVDQDFGKLSERFSSLQNISNIMILKENLRVAGRYYFFYGNLRYYAEKTNSPSHEQIEEVAWFVDQTDTNIHISKKLSAELSVGALLDMAREGGFTSKRTLVLKPLLEGVRYELAWMHRSGMFVTSPMFWE